MTNERLRERLETIHTKVLNQHEEIARLRVEGGIAAELVGKIAEMVGTRPVFASDVLSQEELLTAVRKLASPSAPSGWQQRIAHFGNRYEYVHHLHECPSIGGNGDKDCRCGAVAFLESLDAVPRCDVVAEFASPFVTMLAKLIKQAIADFVVTDASPEEPRG